MKKQEKIFQFNPLYKDENMISSLEQFFLGCYNCGLLDDNDVWHIRNKFYYELEEFIPEQNVLKYVINHSFQPTVIYEIESYYTKEHSQLCDFRFRLSYVLFILIIEEITGETNQKELGEQMRTLQNNLKDC